MKKVELEWGRLLTCGGLLIRLPLVQRAPQGSLWTSAGGPARLAPVRLEEL